MTPDRINIKPLVDVERWHIERAMYLRDGNARQAAIELGIGRTTLYRKLRAYEGMPESPYHRLRMAREAQNSVVIT